MRAKGQALILTLLIVSLLVASLIALAIKQDSQYRQKFEQFMLTSIHSARLDVIELWWSKSSAVTFTDWRRDPVLTELLEKLRGFSRSAEVIQEPLAIELDFREKARADFIHQRLANTQQYNNVVYVLIPQSFTFVDLNFVARTGNIEDSQVNTDISFADRSIGNAKALRTDLISSNLADFGQMVSNDSKFAYSDSNLLQADSIEGVGSQLYQAQLASVRTGFAQLGDHSHINTLSGQETKVERFLSETLASEEFNADLLRVNSLKSHGEVLLRGAAGSELIETHAQFENLQQRIFHCIHISKWCQPAVMPEVALAACVDCEIAQEQPDFVSGLVWSVDNCPHGCEISIEASDYVSVLCDREVLSVHDSGEVNCTVTGTFNELGNYHPSVILSAISKKDKRYRKANVRLLSWSREKTELRQCHALSPLVLVTNSNPLLALSFELPVTGAGELFQEEKTGNSCDMARPHSYYSCSYIRRCGESGTWEASAISCECFY